MAFMKLQIEFYLIDSFRHGNATQICQSILCACSCAHDNVTFMERGLAATIADLTSISESSIRKALVTLQQRAFLTRLDEFSCQINPGFMQKTAKKIKYNGYIQSHPNQDESTFLFKVHTLAVESWELRGKNHKRYLKGEDAMMHPSVKKEFDSLQKQINTMLEILKSVASGSDEAKEKAETHLRLIEGGLSD